MTGERTPLAVIFGVLALVTATCLFFPSDETVESSLFFMTLGNTLIFLLQVELVSFVPLPNLDDVPADTSLYGYYLAKEQKHGATSTSGVKQNLAHSEKESSKKKAGSVKTIAWQKRESAPVNVEKSAKAAKHAAVVVKTGKHAAAVVKTGKQSAAEFRTATSKHTRNKVVADPKYLKASSLKNNVAQIIAARQKKLMAKAKKNWEQNLNEQRKHALRVKELEDKAAKARQLKKTVKNMANAELDKELAAMGLGHSSVISPAHAARTGQESVMAELGLGDAHSSRKIAKKVPNLLLIFLEEKNSSAAAGHLEKGCPSP